MIETGIIENESRTKEIKISKITSSEALVITTFEKAAKALFARNDEMAETVFHELKMVEKSQSDNSKELFKIEDIQSAILIKAILDSLGRIASYSGYIAEVAINTLCHCRSPIM